MTKPKYDFQDLASISTHDTLLISILVAVVLHTLLILGLNFNKPMPDKFSKSIAITLVSLSSKKAPKKAEFLAQNNQIGAGKKLDKPSPAAQQQASSGTRLDKPARKKTIKRQSFAHTQALTQQIAEQKIQQSQKTQKNAEKNQPQLSMEALRQQVAELGAQIRYQTPSSDQDRIKHVNLVSAHKYEASHYIIDWTAKIKKMGNLNYPAVASRPGFSGSLTMDVGIKPDGSIYSLRINKSSGYPALDDAAKRIVRLSAPFPPLPKILLNELDVLVITRTWKFSNESLQTR